MTYDRKRVAMRIKSLRMDKGWDQSDLSRESGVSVATIANIETARSGMAFDTALKMADALGCTMEKLACRDKEHR